MHKKSKIKSLIICESRDEMDLLSELVSNFSELQLVGKCTSTSIALELIIKFKPELIITDTKIRKESIFNIFDFNKKHSPFVIFITEDFSIETIQKSFSYNTISYLKKMPEELDLMKAIIKLKSIYKVVLNAPLFIKSIKQEKVQTQLFYLENSNKYNSVDFDKIVLINSNQATHSILILDDLDEIEIKKSIPQLFHDIEFCGKFIKVGKNQIVNKNFIEQVTINSVNVEINVAKRYTILANRTYRKKVLDDLNLAN